MQCVFAILGYDTEQDIYKEFQKLKLICAYEFPFLPRGYNNDHRPHVTLSYKEKESTVSCVKEHNNLISNFIHLLLNT